MSPKNLAVCSRGIAHLGFEIELDGDGIGSKETIELAASAAVAAEAVVTVLCTEFLRITRALFAGALAGFWDAPRFGIEFNLTLEIAVGLLPMEVIELERWRSAFEVLPTEFGRNRDGVGGVGPAALGRP